MPGESPFNAACEYRAAGLFLDILVPADMIGSALGVDDAFDAPSVLSGNLQYLLRGLLVVSAVNEIDLVFRLPVYAYLRRAVYVVALRTYLFQLVHKDFVFSQLLSVAKIRKIGEQNKYCPSIPLHESFMREIILCDFL